MALHTTRKDKDAEREALAADVAAFQASGGKVQTITPEQYRQHNIEREANRSVTRNMLTLETVMDTTSWDTMEDTRAARFALLSATSGDYSMVDGNDVHMHGDGPLRSRAERDFFKDYDETEIEELIDDDHDYDEWQ
jgi:hypothetical protein